MEHGQAIGQSTVVRRLRSALLLLGAFAFAFLLGEAAHELGHYLAHRAYGHAGGPAGAYPHARSRRDGG